MTEYHLKFTIFLTIPIVILFFCKMVVYHPNFTIFFTIPITIHYFAKFLDFFLTVPILFLQNGNIPSKIYNFFYHSHYFSIFCKMRVYHPILRFLLTIPIFIHLQKGSIPSKKLQFFLLFLLLFIILQNGSIS